MRNEAVTYARHLAGRGDELGQLDAAFDRAAAGLGELVFIVGQPGIGKTALARAAAAGATDKGALVLWGRCWEEGGAPAYWPWVQLLRPLLRRAGNAQALAALGPAVRYLRHLLPELDSETGGDASTAIDESNGRFALFDAVTELLVVAGEQVPLLLVLDDVHAADQPSLLLLEFVVRHLARTRMLLLATCRDADVRLSRDKRELVETIAEEGQRLRLGGLSRPAVAGMMRARGVAYDEELLEAIRDRTEGNPLFVDATLRLLAAHDTPGAEPFPVPEEVRAAVRARLQLVSEPVRALLGVAGVFGRDFSVHHLGEVVQEDTEQLQSRLNEALTAGVLRQAFDDPAHYSFTHGLLREAAYESLERNHRMTLHQRVADVLRAEDIEANLAEIAHHLAAAADRRPSPEAVDYGLRAARRAVAGFGYEEGVAQYERLLAWGTLDDEVRCDVLRELGLARRMGGDVRGSKEAFGKALTVARALGDGRRLALCVLALAGSPQDRVIFQPETDLLREALDALPNQEQCLRARLLARLSTSMLLGRAERQSLHEQATRLADEAGDLDTQVWVLRTYFVARWWPDTVEQRVAAANRLVELAPHSKQADLLPLAQGERALNSLQAGDLATFDDAFETYARLATQWRRPDQCYLAQCMRATVAAMRGRYTETEALAREAYEQARQRVGWAGYILVLALLRPLGDQGRLGELLPFTEELVVRNPGNVTSEALDAWVRHALGADEHARALLDRLFAVRFAPVAEDQYWLTAMALLADLAAAVAHEAAASTLYELLSPFAGRYVVSPPAVAYLGSVDIRLADLAALLGDTDEAEAHLLHAIRLERRICAHVEALRAELRHAELLLARGAAEDAATLVERVTGDAALLDATRLADGARALAERLTATATCTADDRGDEGRRRLRCEGDVWLVEFGGTHARVKASKGLSYLAVLLAHPGQELHALAVVAAGQGAEVRHEPADIGELALRTGERGDPLLDAAAKAAYRRRLEDLRDELDEAESLGDTGRASRAREEIDFLASELAAAVGLGGRDRRSASSGERARVSVTKALRSTISRLATVSPALGDHLRATIRTGTYCSYTPDPQAPAWEL